MHFSEHTLSVSVCVVFSGALKVSGMPWRPWRARLGRIMRHGVVLVEQNGECDNTTKLPSVLLHLLIFPLHTLEYEVRSIWTITCKAIKMILCPAFISETLRGGCVQDNKGPIVLIFSSLTLLPSSLIFPSASCHMWSGVSHVAMPHGSARWCFHSRPKQPGAEPNIGAHWEESRLLLLLLFQQEFVTKRWWNSR